MNKATPPPLIPAGLSPEQMYRELKCIASAYMAREEREHTLQPTALVHEALVRLAQETARRAEDGGAASPGWRDAGEFLRFAVVAMQRILIEHARRKRSLRRGGRARRVRESRGARPALVELPANETTNRAMDQYGKLDSALVSLESRDERATAVVRLRFFAGLTIEECAKAIGVSYQTVESDWRFARAFIGRSLGWIAESTGKR